MFELESIDLTLRLRPRIYPAGKSLNGVVCIEHPLIRRPSQVTYIQTHRMHAVQCYLPWSRWLDRLMCATIEQHECLDCRRGLSHILIEMLNLIDHTILFNLHLSTHGQQIKCCADVKCPPYSLILIFLSWIYIHEYRYSWFLSLSTMCTNNFLRWTHKRRRRRRQKYKHQLIWSSTEEYKRKEKKRHERERIVYFNGMYLFKWHIFE